MPAALDPISAAAAAFEARLRPFFTKEKWEWHLVAFPMEVDAFKSLVGHKTPALALAFVQAKASGGGRRYQAACGWKLMVIVKNPSRQAAFLGDRAGPGLFPAMMGAVQLLNGATFDGLGTAFCSDVFSTYSEGYDNRDLAMATIDVSMTVQLGDVAGLADAPDFLRLLSAFDGPFGDPDSPIDMRPA